jgi:3-deoxy-manno-octulosonate cytidylyltransferase (CMP-KDO synthetase)
MKVIGIIPARYGSTRFPGKPLAMIGDKTMIQRVYEQVAQVKEIDEVWVATDNERIVEEVCSFGGCVALTGKHWCGTDRCAEVARELHLKDNDIIINVQGDMPFIQPFSISVLIYSLQTRTDLVTLVTKCEEEEYKNPNRVKVTLNSYIEVAEKFSRANILGTTNYKHIGVYGYTMTTLQMLSNVKGPMPSSNLEQERWMNEEFYIRCEYVHDDVISIDTPEDLIRANEYLQKQ